MTVPQTLSALDDVGNFFSVSFLHSLIYLEGGPATVHTRQPEDIFLFRSQFSPTMAAAGTSYLLKHLISQMLALWGALVRCISRYSTVRACLTTPWLDEDLMYRDKGRRGKVCQYLFVCMLVSLFRVKFRCCTDRTSFMNSGDSPAPDSWASGTTGMRPPTVAVHSAMYIKLDPVTLTAAAGFCLAMIFLTPSILYSFFCCFTWFSLGLGIKPRSSH